MADLKISQLPSATTPLAGTEVLPIVQSSATKQVSIANLTAGRSVSVADATLTTGNLTIGTSGKGIDFSATPGTGTSELLADYEEGTFTPELSASGASFTYGANYGRYVKIGSLVIVDIRLTVTSASGGSGSVKLIGLPFASAPGIGGLNVGQQGLIGRASYFAANTPNCVEVNSGVSTASIYYRSTANGGANSLNFSDVGSSADFLLTASYRTA